MYISHGFNLNSMIFFADAQRSAARLSTDLLKHGAYTKLELSLHCGLPNEVDFALNVCLLLSAEGHHVFNLTLSSHMISVLMAAVGVFEEGLDVFISAILCLYIFLQYTFTTVQFIQASHLVHAM